MPDNPAGLSTIDRERAILTVKAPWTAPPYLSRVGVSQQTIDQAIGRARLRRWQNFVWQCAEGGRLVRVWVDSGQALIAEYNQQEPSL